MKDDLISKTAAIDAVEEIPWYHQNKNGEMVQGANSREHQAWYKADDIYHALYTLPPTQRGWIPTSEILPGKSAAYLVTIKWGDDEYDIECLEYNDYSKEWNDGDLCGWRVIAWMPLPTPYREGEKP